jgi:hypothetical protein
MSTSKRKCRMMGDIDAARKKEGKKKPKQLCMRLSPSKTFHTKICLQNYEEEEEEEEEEEKKKKRGPIQRNYIISSWFTTGPETQNKATITKRSNRQQQASKQAAALPQQWQPENKRLKKADSPEIKTKNKK